MIAIASIWSVACQKQRGITSSSTKELLGSYWFRVALLTSIVAAGMAVRGYRLADRSIWYDESSSWRMSQAAFPEMMSRIVSGSHPPLYYFVLRLWTEVFGDSLWAMRGLSIMLAGVTMIGVYLFVQEASYNRDDLAWSRNRSQWTGMFAAALVATSVLHIRASWDARMYTLGTALLALSSWTLFRALHDSTHSWRKWLTHGIVTLLFLYTHYFALFSIAAQVLFIGGFLMQRNLWNASSVIRDMLFRRALSIYIFVAVGWSVWLPVFLRQRAQHEEYWWTGTFSPAVIPSACRKLFLLTIDVGAPNLIGTLLLIAFALVVLGILWKGREAGWYAATMTCVPLYLCVMASSFGRNVFEVRYLIFAHLFFLVSVALLVGRIGVAPIRNGVAALLLANFLIVYIEYWNMLRIADKPGIRGAVAYIEAEKNPNEPVIVTSPMLYYPATYHIRIRDRARWRVYNAGEPFPFFAGGAIASPKDFILPKEIHDIKAGRVWLVEGWGSSSLPIPRHWHPKSIQTFDEVFAFQGTVLVTQYHIAARIED